MRLAISLPLNLQILAKGLSNGESDRVQVHASKPPGRMQMPSSAVVTLSDPDEYAAAFRNAKVEITVTGRGQFTAELTSIDLHRLQMQRYDENLPRVVHWAGTSERAVIAFRTEPGPSLLWGGA